MTHSPTTKRPTRSGIWRAGAILLAGLIATVIAACYTKSDVDADAKREFDFACQEIRSKIADRLSAHEQILRSGAAYFENANGVTRNEWRSFTERQKVAQELPGIQGIGFALLIPAEQLAQHIQGIRAEGFPDYRVRPEDEREIYSSIIYLEPFADRNLRAFGYDMLTEPVRREALERARDQDTAALSGKVVLVQETNKEVQAGTLMYVPVYRKGMPCTTVAERRAAIVGWVYSPYRMNDLMQGILGRWDLDKNNRIYLKVFDGEKLSSETMLYDSQPTGGNTPWPASGLTLQTSVDSAGRRWTLCFTEGSGIAATADYSKPWFVLLGGTSVSLLLFGLSLSRSNTQFNAWKIAHKLTEEIRRSEESMRENEEKHRAVFASIADPLFMVDQQTNRILDVNVAATKVYGYSYEEIVRLKNTDLSAEPEETALASRTPELFSYIPSRYHKRKDGSVFPVEITASTCRVQGKTIIVASARDITERKQAENSLRQITDRLSLAARAGGVGIWDYDVVNNRLVWDDQMFHLYGIAREQFSGAYEAWQAGLHPEDRQRGNEEIQLALRGEKDFNTELRVVWPDGTIRSIRALAIVQRDASGQPLRMIGTNWDITAQKRAEEELAEKESQIRLLLDSTAEAIYGLDMNGNCTFCNNSCLRLLGYKHPDELLGKNMHWQIHAKREDGTHLPVEECCIFRAFQEGEGAHADDEVLWRSDGTSFPAEYWSYPQCRDGAIVGAVVTFIDITERKHADNELQWKTAFLEAQVNSSLDGILVIDRQQKRLISNQRIHEQWNVPQHILDDPDDTALLRHVVSLTKNPQQFLEKVTYLYDHPNETSRDEIEFKDGMVLDRYSAPVLGKDGQYYGRIWTFHDVTEQKRTEKSLQKYAGALEATNDVLKGLNQAAESATRAKSEFLANMSHEIRTPMTAILGFSDLLLDKDFRGDMREHVEVIKRNGTHMLGLINDILDLSKVEAGKMQIEPTRCSPVQLTAEIVSLMRVRAEAKHLKIRADLTPPLPETVLTDPLRLRQVLVNLMGNAIKFTDQGEVSIALRLTNDSGSSRLRFDVTDTGIGMNEEQIGRLFQAFSQVDNSAARKFGGTGLGLCISKRLTEAMGGNIEVQSAPGKGSTFSVTIDPGPLDGVRMIQNTQGTLREHASTPTVESPNKIKLHSRVLLAEDGPDNQDLLCALLGDAGADVTTVENGQLAVEAALAASKIGRPFDVILMDMQMPVMDGYEATRRLRADGYATPIVALTAHAMADDCQKCLDAGCSDYATKPIDWQKLLAMIAQWTARTSTESSAPGKRNTDSVTVETGNLDGVGLMETPLTATVAATPSSFEAIVASIRLGCHILLAEDGPDNQRLIGLLLKKAGAEITTVENGQLAVEAALAASKIGRPFDVILMDMQMPVMDGYSATRELRAQECATPIVALTAHASAEARKKCIDAGCDDIATKPIDRQRLLATVAQWTNRAPTDSSMVRDDISVSMVSESENNPAIRLC